ncbi:MAG: nucleoside 2-deoxyribosyltransferase [Nanoarchaeota archaeon]
MKIYFAASIRAGRHDRSTYETLIRHCQKCGEVLTEHVSDAADIPEADKGKVEHEIYKRDMAWLMSADVVIAEVTTPSLGVGYEIAKAEVAGKKVLCLWRPADCKHLSAMIAGTPHARIVPYKTVHGACQAIDDFLMHVRTARPSMRTMRATVLR